LVKIIIIEVIKRKDFCKKTPAGLPDFIRGVKWNQRKMIADTLSKKETVISREQALKIRALACLCSANQ
jgi:hypothetical protein